MMPIPKKALEVTDGWWGLLNGEWINYLSILNERSSLLVVGISAVRDC